MSEKQEAAPQASAPERQSGSMEETTRTVGRGFLFILGAKVYFLIAGFAANFGLPRLFLVAARAAEAAGKTLALPAQAMAAQLYGDYGLAVRTVSWINNSMVQGTIQAVSKFVSEDESQADLVKAAALRVQAVVGGSLALGYFLLADVLATQVFRSPRLAASFRVTSVIILAYALYAVFIGYLNGRKRFRAQAAFDMTYSTIKTASILALAVLGFGLHVVLGGFAGAAVAVCLLAAGIVGIGRKGPGGVPLPWRRVARAMGIVVVYYVFFNSLLTADLWVLRRLAGGVTGVSPEKADLLASALVGIYNGVLNVALLPYQGVLAVAFVAFPLISKATFDQDLDVTRGYIRQTLRYSLVFVGLIAAVVGASPQTMLGLLHPDFVAGAPALTVYVSGEVFFALFAIANTMIIASGHMGIAAVIAAVVLVLDVAANLLIVPHFVRLTSDGILSPDALLAAAGATAPVFLIGFLISSAFLMRRFGARLSLLSALRVLGVGGAVLFGASFVAGPGIVRGGLVMAGGGVAYLVGLVLTRELGAAELARLSTVLRRKKA